MYSMKQSQSNSRFRFISQQWDRSVALVDTTRARILMIASIAILGLLYLWLVNTSATSGFYLSDLEKRTASLNDEYRKLLVQETELRSLSHIQEQSKDMALVPVETMEYAPGDSAVAVVNQR